MRATVASDFERGVRTGAAMSFVPPRGLRFVVLNQRRDTRRERRADMGQPVVHFEVVGKDGAKLQSYYSDLFGWKIDTNNPMNYGIVNPQDNDAPEGIPHIGGGVGQVPEGYDGHVTFYIGVD